MKNMLRYQKYDRVWVRNAEGNPEYFSIIEWRYLSYSGNRAQECFCVDSDFGGR
jgi:hypothetical protein